MLSISGLTLEQFADLMGGLGYSAEKGERPKVKPVAALAEIPAKPEEAAPEADPVAEVPGAALSEAEPEAGDTEAASAEADPIAQDPGAAPAEAEPGAGDTEAAPADATDATEVSAQEPEAEVFYTFTWGRQRNSGGQRPRTERKGASPRGKDGHKGRGKPKGKPGGGKPQGKKSFSAKPPRKEKEIDPDNPFAAALMGLKQND
jgi:ATP-dependent RNA helicase SUPV3L1/SUV3